LKGANMIRGLKINKKIAINKSKSILKYTIKTINKSFGSNFKVEEDIPELLVIPRLVKNLLNEDIPFAVCGHIIIPMSKPYSLGIEFCLDIYRHRVRLAKTTNIEENKQLKDYDMEYYVAFPPFLLTKEASSILEKNGLKLDWKEDEKHLYEEDDYLTSEMVYVRFALFDTLRRIAYLE
jgi:hypothetical protein